MTSFSVCFITMRMRVLLLFVLPLLHLTASYTSPSMQRPLPQCHDHESFALLQFKKSLVIDESSSSDPFAYPKVASWGAQGEGGDCCSSWDGVECDRDSGNVIGLDLSSSCLHGPISSNSTLFHLVHLRSLNLADNNFTNSKIPAGFQNLSRLFHLNLSRSSFYGQVPSEILELSELVSLDLSENSLELQNPGLKNLVETLTSLELLHLTGVNVSSTVPPTMANLSSLSFLFLEDCGLLGEFPIEIFQLPKLRFFSVRHNPYLTGYLPQFQWGDHLRVLRLAETNFSGQLPDSIGNLKSLNHFDVRGCDFSRIPSSLGNLTNLNYLDLSSNNFSEKIPSSFVNLVQITFLSLSFNNFVPGTLHWLGNLTKLNVLQLTQTNSYGDIPSSFGNLTQLTSMGLQFNKLTGQFPSWIGNLTWLMDLTLEGNNLHGSIPGSISRLQKLENLNLAANSLSGTFTFDLFLKSRNLVSLQLSDNNLSLDNRNTTITLPEFQVLGLAGCNLSGEFPKFLQNQNHMEFLELSNNKIEGHIPEWFMKLGTKTLWLLNLAGNLLTGFEQPVDVLPWDKLELLKLSSNKLQGPLPIPASSIFTYKISDNNLTGEIPPMICNLTSLLVLELSNNNLNGMLPECLGNISNSASILDLRNNSFSGDIPQTFSRGCSLRVLDLRQNNLEGKIPRSLGNCANLQILNLEHNKIKDVFPSWLGILQELRVLILKYNGFYGVIGKPSTNVKFPMLQIVDLSNNTFSGELPLEYFQGWTAMKTIHKQLPKYMEADTSFQSPKPNYRFMNEYNFSMTITNKRVIMSYGNIPENLAAIDLSSNKFEGSIPEVIGDLKELILLNLSNNFLTGPIPPSLENLKQLEALDLSQNKLSGEIPTQLTQLTFLELFNVSHNFLSGPIPQGNQFQTFDDNSSFAANSGLCGKPLSKKCRNGDQDSPPAPNLAVQDSAGSPFEFGWKVVVIGYASGLVIGGIIGCIKDTRKDEMFVKNAYARWRHRRAN